MQFSKCLTSAIEGLLCYVCMKGVCLVISPRNASGSREKKRSSMALDVATLPLILYRNIPIEHVLHCDNILHIPTLFYYFAIPTPFFHFQCFFYLYYIGTRTYS